MRHPPAGTSSLVLDDDQPTIWTQVGSESAKDQGLVFLGDEVQCIGKERPVEGGERKLAREVAAECGDAAAVFQLDRCCAKSLERGGISVDGDHLSSWAQQRSKREREGARAGAEIGPGFRAVWESAFDEGGGVAKIHVGNIARRPEPPS